MRLTKAQVPAQVKEMLDYRDAERGRLDRIFLYLRDPDPQTNLGRVGYSANGPLRWLPTTAPDEVKRLAEIARVNMLRFVVNATTQVMYVDGYRTPNSEDEEPAWEAWQKNRLDARQTGVHRSALSYGASYVTVLPGDPVPVVRGAGPRKLTAVYGDDDDWPELALELRRSPSKDYALFRLFDDRRVFWVRVDSKGSPELVDTQEHRAGVVPVVRFLTTVDDDVDDVVGEVEPLIPLQDQINITTFGLLVAQHYGAFRQRYVIGWLAENEKQAAEASARKLWTFEDPDVKVNEFGQTDLKGYLDSREATLRHLATVSQTPAHELLGQLVNLSADALAMAERSHRAKVSERQAVMGEAWEQVLELAGKVSRPRITTDFMASVRWRDTEARSMAQMADALGKLVTMLGVPPQEIWEKIPGVSQQDVERWKAAAAEGDAFANLTRMLDRNAAPADDQPGEVPA